jgi:peptidyl-prolyl cis-trans isomerase SurA
VGVLLVTAYSSLTHAQSVDYIAAIVNDSVITYREVEEYTSQAYEALRRTYQGQPDVFKQRMNQTMQDGLEQLLEKQLILDEFKTMGGRLPETVIEDEVRERIRQRWGDRATLTRNLKAQGITFEAFRKRIHDEIVLEYMRRKNVSSAIIISPAKIEQYYQANLSEFQESDQVKLRMIILNKSGGAVDDLRRLGLEIVRKMEEGASFTEMAAVYSEGSTRRDSGDWGWVQTNKLNRGLSDVAFSLQRGQRSSLLALARDGSDAYWVYHYDKDGHPISGKKYSDKGETIEERSFENGTVAGGGAGSSTPVAQINGDLPAPPQEFYLMFVEDRRAARTRSLAEVREEIEKNLTTTERGRLHKKWIDKLKEKAFVRYF